MHKNYPKNYFPYLFNELDSNEQKNFEYQIIHQKKWLNQIVLDRLLIQDLKKFFDTECEMP